MPTLTKEVNLLSFANEMRLRKQFIDVYIQAGDQRIGANRLVLAYGSEFFRAMFSSPFKEKYQDTIDLPAFDGETIRSIIDFFYTGTLTINDQNITKIFSIKQRIVHEAVYCCKCEQSFTVILAMLFLEILIYWN